MIETTRDSSVDGAEMSSFSGWETEDLIEALKKSWAEFDVAGGRGVELADRIDDMVTELESRGVDRWDG